MKVLMNVNPGRIADLMVTAIEGGSEYWCQGIYLESHQTAPYRALGDSRHELNGAKKGEKTWWYDDEHLFDDERATEPGEHPLCIRVIDDEDVEHIVGHDEIAKGIEIMATKYGRHFSDFMSENEDATTADVFLQCVALGDIVYG